MAFSSRSARARCFTSAGACRCSSVARWRVRLSRFRRGLLAAFGITVLVIVLAVAPLAGSPDLLGAPVAGVAVASRFVGSGLAHAIGIGIAFSIGGVMLAEYVALTRLARAVAGWRPRPVSIVIGVMMMIAAAISLTDPDGFYDALLRPSLVALWLSQLIVFLVYPRFARDHGRSLPAASRWR